MLTLFIYFPQFYRINEIQCQFKAFLNSNTIFPSLLLHHFAVKMFILWYSLQPSFLIRFFRPISTFSVSLLFTYSAYISIWNVPQLTGVIGSKTRKMAKHENHFRKRISLRVLINSLCISPRFFYLLPKFSIGFNSI